jgi:hypothetical protein
MAGSNDVFEAAKAARAMAEAQKGGGGFVKIFYAPMPSNGDWLQIRVLGNPLDIRQGDKYRGIPADPSAPKSVLLATPKADNGKQMRWVFPPREQDTHWSWRILNKVLASSYDNTTKSRTYHHSHLPIFQKVFNNSSGNKLDKGWRPKDWVVMNVICRELMAAHTELKKTAVLTKKAVQIANSDRIYYDVGAPMMVHDLLWKIVEHFDDYNDYDIVVRKVDPAAQPWYEVAPVNPSDFRLTGAKLFPEYANAPLSEEELSWQRWNFDELYPITKAHQVLKRLELSIQEIDATFREHFTEELRDIASRELAEEAERKKNGEPTSYADLGEETLGSDLSAAPASYAAPVQAQPVYAPQQPAAPSSSAVPLATPTSTAGSPFGSAPAFPPPAQAPVAQAPGASAAPPVRQRVAAPAPVSAPVDPVAVLTQNGWSGASKLTPEEQSWLLEVLPDGVPAWGSAGGELVGCPGCGTAAPEKIHCCPFCGTEF